LISIARLRLGTKLLLLSSAGLLASALIAAVGAYNLHVSSTAETFLAEDAVPSLKLVAAINDEVGNIRENQLNLVIVKDAADVAAESKDMAESTANVAKLMTQYERSIDNDQERAMFTRVRDLLAAYQRTTETTLAGAKLADPTAADENQRFARVDSGKAYDTLGDAIDALGHYNEQAVAAAHSSAVAAHLRAQWTLGTLTLATALVLAALAFFITRGLLRQFGGEPVAAVSVARAVAQGDLSAPITLKPGDTDSVMASLKEMQSSLGRTVLDVRRNAEGVATASSEIAQGNSDLSARTEQQASALEETAASMEQLGAAVRQNADNAHKANELAAGASKVAANGGAVVGEVVDTMKGINESSKRIADIIGVIDGIAFQTNILALNAAVEAARAGEQGRGFAVVASEVRSLAKRSADAAKEIKSLIGTSVERVEHGTLLVDRARSTMQEVVTSIGRVTEIMVAISAASSEQSAGVQQVGEAVTQMDQATQQNAALVEQSAAAAESLKHQSQQLVQAVAVFRTNTAPA
jgi:methyl-accepting chemotaxis protein